MTNDIELTTPDGKTRKGKHVNVSSVFNHEITEVWERLQNISTLMEICKPYARFTSAGAEMPETWKAGERYTFNLFFHFFLPVGAHTIYIKYIDEGNYKVQSREHNKLVPVWNHLIRLEALENGQTKYTDEIDIYAGFLPPPFCVAWWSRKFYKHRQKKWLSVLE